MAPAWMEVRGGGTVDRLTFAKGGVLWPEGSEGDRLEFSTGPDRVVFLGQGSPPTRDAAPFRSLVLEPGVRFQYAGRSFLYRVEAPLQEISVRGAVDVRSGGSAEEVNPFCRLVEAGLLVDLGRVDTAVLGRVQKSVLAGDFDAHGAAADLLAHRREGADAQANRVVLEQRAARLLRDFAMASRTKGAAGLARRGRSGAKHLLAALLVQVGALAVYSVILFLAGLLWRQRGHSLDGVMDSILGFFGGGG